VTLRSHDDALSIRERLAPGLRLVVIGGGFIGLELAAAARAHGSEVIVLEALPRLLSRAVPEEIAALIEARHRAEGVEIICGASLTAVTEDGAEVALHLADGRRIAADLVVMGVGVAPDTALAEAAGLAVDNGIAVDATLATSDPAILAAGDCCSFPHPLYDNRRIRIESWRSAQEQGGLAARNMLGAAEPVSAVPWFWSDQYELGLQIAGLPSFGTQIVRRDNDAGLVLFNLADDGRLVAASGIGPGNAVARDIRLAEMLIARRARPDREALARPEVSLKSLLAGT
jgi:3-phenylpropionate/trans-cinnamate dioxygenase ferredoxin reductase subunit